MHREFDALVVGAGAAGLRAALELGRERVRVAVVSKLHPTRSSTGSSQGGICAALGSGDAEDRWEWHLFDTVRGGDYLVDQDAAEVLAQEAIDAVIELEHLGLAFDRATDGRIDQQRAAGHTRDGGPDLAGRSCTAGDRTGSQILHTLYQQCLEAGVAFLDEHQVVDLLFEGGTPADGARVAGLLAWRIADGELVAVRAKAVVLATGGSGRIFRVTSNAYTSTGDGAAIAYRHGIPLQDLEFVGFEPTGIPRVGVLVPETARVAGGRLVNGAGERFVDRWAPRFGELAPPDVVSRAIAIEVREGRGLEGLGAVALDLRALDRAVLERSLPDTVEQLRTFLGIDPRFEPVPVEPTAHSTPGGIPTDLDGRVTRDAARTVVPGLFAAGEVASPGVHGAAVLTGNALADALVFGRRAGRAVWREVRTAEMPQADPSSAGGVGDELDAIRTRVDGESAPRLRARLADVMSRKVGILRDGPTLESALADLRELRDQYARVKVQDRSRTFNTDLLEARELGHLLDFGEAIAAAALARRESRGAHAREDYPERDDVAFLTHSLVTRSVAGPQVDHRPVIVTRFAPQPRSY